MSKELIGIDRVDVRGNLETIEHLARIGIILIDFSLYQHLPTVLEDIQEHIQRLVMEYAVDEQGEKTV